MTADQAPGCFGKQRFATYDDADRVAAKARGGRPGNRATVYQCKSCKHWHIGSSLRRKP